MATSTKTKKPKATEAAPPVSKAPARPHHSIRPDQSSAKPRDLLSPLLKDGQQYTHDQVQSLIENFMKGKVK